MKAEMKTSPVSRLLQVRNLPGRGVEIEFEADVEQREALARVHGLQSVERFAVDLTARPWKSDGILVNGRVVAQITQACVVTLEPLPARVEEAVTAVFVPERSRLARADAAGGEIVLDAEGDDLPETFAGNSIDIGALAEESFALGIDPYPRKPDAQLAGGLFEAKGESPAGALRRELGKLRRNR